MRARLSPSLGSLPFRSPPRVPLRGRYAARDAAPRLLAMRRLMNSSLSRKVPPRGSDEGAPYSDDGDSNRQPPPVNASRNSAAPPRSFRDLPPGSREKPTKPARTQRPSHIRKFAAAVPAKPL